ncbi:MAG: hypothetical protein AAFQ37_01830, partial [Bacteroidota bacterium]
MDSSTDPTCGFANGAAMVSATGGNPPYTFEWFLASDLTTVLSTSETISDVTEGDYLARATDQDGCVGELIITLTSSPAAEIALVEANNATCGDANGAIIVGPEAGTAGFTYSWSHDPLLTGTMATGLTAGDYQIIMSDALGCEDTLDVILINIPGPALTVVTLRNNSCDDANGFIEVGTVLGTAPFTYDWSHDATITGVTAENLSAGTYTVTITDANGCEDILTETIIDENILTVSIQSTTPTACNTPTGSITVAASGGVGVISYSWSHDANLNAAEATGLAAGAYTVLVSDELGCLISLEATVTEVEGPGVTNIDITDASCGDAVGAIMVTITGGMSPYTYLWSHDNTIDSPNITDLAAGLYNLTVTDANGCTLDTFALVTSTNAPSLSLDATTNPTCALANGGAAVSASGGTSPYTFEWFLSSDLNTVLGTAETISGISAGIYLARVTDAEGCVGEVVVTLVDELAASISTSTTDASCFDAADGTATVTVLSGGTAPFTYLWDDPDGQAMANATGLAAGIYNVTVTDADGCVSTTSAEVSAPDEISVVLVGNIEPSCFGGEDGLLSVTVNGGTEPYTIQWTGDNLDFTGAVLSGIAAGDYTVEVTDANGCTNAQVVTLGQPDPVAITAENIAAPACNGSAGGSATVSASGGNSPYTYAWDDPAGQTGPSAFDLDPGTYTVTATDANGCQEILQVDIPLGATLEVILEALGDPSCNGETDGTIDISVTGGSGNYSFQWNDPDFQQSEDAAGLEEGQYIVIVSDLTSGCIVSDTFELTQPEALAIVNTEVSNPSCASDTDGTAAVTGISGGTEPYSYQWDDPNGQTTAIATGLAAGNYSVTVTDANGCSVSNAVNVTAPDPILVMAVSTIFPSCNGGNDGSLEVEVMGGTPDYTIFWPDLNVNGPSVSGLAAGGYTAEITDANGCDTTITFILTEPEALTLSAGDIIAPQCDGSIGGSLTVDVDGGTEAYTYLWDDPLGQTSATAFDLDPGVYTVTVTDANGCSSTLSMEVPDASTLSIELTESIEPSCNGFADGSLTVLVSGGSDNYSYLWNDIAFQTTPTASNLSAGEYILQVSNPDGSCLTVDTFILSEPEPLVVTPATSTSPSCLGTADGAATINLAGGTVPYVVNWPALGDDLGTAVTGLNAGTYVYEVIDANGCSITDSIVIEDPDSIAVIIETTQPVCAADMTGAISLTTSGGTGTLSYNWPSLGVNTPAVSGLPPGIYEVQITDENACTKTEIIGLTALSPEISLDTISINAPGCSAASDGSITVLGVGGSGELLYSWSNGSTTASIENLVPDIYIATVTDENGCTSTAEFDLTDVTAFSFSLPQNDTTICLGQLIELGEEAVENRVYSWTGPNNFSSSDSRIGATQAGNYVLSVEQGGCTATDSVLIVELGEALQTLFVIPTQVVVGDTVVALEVSWPVPDVVEWIYDLDSVLFLGNNGNQTLFQFPYPGQFEIELMTTLGSCEGLIGKTVSVFPDSTTLAPIVDLGNRQILSIGLSPNPNSGQFTLDFELNNQDDYLVQVIDVNGTNYDTRNGVGQGELSESYD